VLQETLGGLLARLRLAYDHVAEHSSDREEALCCGAHIVEPDVVEEDLLHDERRDRLGELGAYLHGAEAQRDDLRREEEVDYFGVVYLHGVNTCMDGWEFGGASSNVKY